MTQLSDYQQTISDAIASSAFATWRKQNPREYTAWTTYDAEVRLASSDSTILFTPCQTHYAQMLRDVGKAYTDLLPAAGPPPPPPPPPPTVSGVGLYSLGDGPQGFSHLDDGTYDLVIGPWSAISFLDSLPSAIDVYAYTVVAGTPGAVSPEYVLLSPSNPASYIAQVQAALAGTRVKPFIDNVLLEIAGLTAAVQQVGTAMRADGKGAAVNLGSYLAGDDLSDDGELWADRVAVVGPYLDGCMLENWAQFSGGASIGQPRTNSNDSLSSWQLCPAAAAKAGTRMIAVTYNGEPLLTYGRAALLLSPGVDSVAVFATGADTNTDPYDATWTKPNPSPVLNQQTGTATL